MFARKSLSITVVTLLLLTVSAVSCASGALTTAAGVSPVSRAAVAQMTDSEAMPRTITVTGSGSANATPDIAQVQLGVEISDSDAGAAIQQSNERMTAVMDALKEQGIAEKDIQTVQFNMSVEEQRDKDGQLTGEVRYHIINRVRVKVRDLSQTGNVIQAALDAGANTVDNIGFSIEDSAGLEQMARDDAIANATAVAEQLATGFGAQLGPIRQVQELGVSRPVPEAARSLQFDAAAPVPVSGGELSVSVQIQAVFDIGQ
jgi:uncharacterized protein YggE